MRVCFTDRSIAMKYFVSPIALRLSVNELQSINRVIFQNYFFFASSVFKSLVFCAFVIMTISFVTHTNAGCCESAFNVRHVCLSSPNENVLSVDIVDNSQYWAEKCETRFCKNGLVPEFYCSVRNCDLSGCNCTGSCIKGNGINQDKIKNVWHAKHDLVSHTKYKF